MSAPPLSGAGWACTSTAHDSNLHYACRRASPDDYAGLGRYEFEHLLRPEFWIFTIIIFCVVSNTSNENPIRFVHRLLAKLGLGSRGWAQPHSRVMQTGAFLFHLAILWLAWIEGCMVLSTDWRMMWKVLIVWRPRLSRFRLWPVALFPVWVIISILCLAVVVLTLVASAGIVTILAKSVADVALVVAGIEHLRLDDNQGSSEGSGGDEHDKHKDQDLEKSASPSAEETSEVPTPLHEKNQA
ncbi:hypothetical protein NUW58_g4973 [Xylaria curta]|uniref:Uncharacterized protein n=1 Tax=Xylaria curta TaxID=42375 RepID=A0ACC1P662_9PEZI|nr:hypothetical protein NUW58_g4973 [Xylaria curta]